MVRSALAVTAALVFVGSAATSRAQQEIFGVDGETPGDSAMWVAKLGDVNGDGITDFLVGAPDAYQSSMFWGAVYVRSGLDGSLLYSIIGDASGFGGKSPGTGFGGAVAGIGDVDGDGVNDIAIGSPGSPNALLKRTGALWVYSGRSGAKIYETYGTVSRFGTMVAGLGDLDLDGVPDIMVGALLEDPLHCRVSLVSGVDGRVIQSFLRIHEFGFGVSGCSAGDFNGDGIDDVLIGNDSASNSAGDLEAGACCVYSGANQMLLRAYEGERGGDRFGSSCALIGDVDGDGVRDHLIGARRASSLYKPYNLGVAYVFSGASGALIRKLEISSDYDGYFATCVADAGDVDGDGTSDFLVGFTAQNARDASSNGAWLYSGRGAVPLYCFEGVDLATFSVAGLGDVTGDGRSEVLVGALGNQVGGSWDGMVRMYAGAELYLSPNYRSPAAGDTLTLQTAQGIPGNPTLPVLVAFDGVPKFAPLGPATPFAADGTSLLVGTVPAGLAGHTMLVQAYAIDAAGKLIRTIPEAIAFQ